MDSVSDWSSPSSACAECSSSVNRAWEKIQVEKKRLSLQKERLALDQEMIKAEKKNFKRNAKLLKRQEIEFQKRLTKEELGLTGSKTANASIELKECQEQLAETQRSLAEMLVERNSMQRERDTFKELVSKGQEDQKLNGQHDEQKIAELEERLKIFERENQQLKEESKQLQESVEIAQKAANKEATLTSEDLQRENERLQKTVIERERQIEDWKLLIPRNKLLLEQAHAKNERLQNQLKELQERTLEQEDFIKEIQLTKEALVKQRERHQTEFKQLQSERDDLQSNYEQTKEVLESLDIDNMQPELKEKREQLSSIGEGLVSDENINSEVSPYIIPLPFDQQPDSMKEKKHVIEWDWSGRSLNGKYTGWFNLEGNPDGQGTLRIDDGALYVGQWKNGLRHGFGVYTSIDGDLYKVCNYLY